MGKMKDLTIDAGEEVMQAVGELHATTNEVTNIATEVDLDHEEVQGWLTTIFKAILGALK